MSLQAKLDKMREQFESTAPPETLEIMHRSINDLLASGIMDDVLKNGENAPGFSLIDQHDDRIDASALLFEGPLVINFYRGVW